MKTTTATTFEVSDVVRAVQPLPEVPYKQALSRPCSRRATPNGKTRTAMTTRTT